MPRRKKTRPASQPESIASILRSEQRDLSKYQPIWKKWREAVGKEVALRANPESITISGVLTVGVNSPVWMQELQFLKPKIVEAVNKACGATLVSDIFFRPQHEKETRSSGAPTSRPSKPAGLPPLDRENLSIIGERINNLQDSELKDTLTLLLQKMSK